MKIYRASEKTRRRVMRESRKAVRSARNVTLPMKHYAGNYENNQPEFEEDSQNEIKIDKFLRRPELWRRNQVKLQLNDESLWFEFDFLDIAALLLEEHGITDVPSDCCVNWRISGKKWRFPKHFDCVHQYIVHLFGKKKWLLDDQETVLGPGDVLFLPMGTHHATKNEEDCLIMNLQYIPKGMEDENKRLRAKFEETFPKRVQNINDMKDFR